MKTGLLILSLVLPIISFTQNTQISSSIETTGMAGTGSTLPFWLIHNQLGRYSPHSSWQELTEGIVEGTTAFSGNLKLTYGADLSLRFGGNETDAQIIQAYAGLSGKIFSVKLGTFANEEFMSGLSSGNGDLLRSVNYRPYPMIRLSTTGFIPVRHWLQLKAEYDEGILNGQRVVDNPHLHHKSLAFKFLLNKTFRISAGMSHCVFWGGTLPSGEKLPDNLKSYFKYVLGKSGDARFGETEQDNAAGNQLGTYQLTFEKDFEKFDLQFMISHPFEDRSGMELDNFRDNLYTIHFRKKQQGTLFDEWILEYLYTKNQSGSVNGLPGTGSSMRGRDQYFNNGIYKTGFSYHGYSMGTPLFYPLFRNEEGIDAGFSNNRVVAFHTGARGYLSKQLNWKAMLTWSRNYGTYDYPYSTVRKQLYSLLELSWSAKNLPLSFSSRLAADLGAHVPDEIGLALGLQWKLR